MRLRSHRWGPSLGVGGPVGCGGWWALGQAAVLRAAVGGRRSGRRRSFGPRLVAGARVPLSCRQGCPHRWHPRCAAPAENQRHEYQAGHQEQPQQLASAHDHDGEHRQHDAPEHAAEFLHLCGAGSIRLNHLAGDLRLLGR